MGFLVIVGFVTCLVLSIVLICGLVWTAQDYIKCRSRLCDVEERQRKDFVILLDSCSDVRRDLNRQVTQLYTHISKAPPKE